MKKIIKIVIPLNYLIIAIITLFSTFITYHFLYEYLYTNQWWKNLNLGKLIVIFIFSSIFFSLLFKIGKRLFHCRMSIQILIYSIVTIVSIYQIHYQNLPPVFLTKYIFYYPEYLNCLFFFVIYYILLYFGIFFISIILNSIDMILALRIKKEVEEQVAKKTEDVNPYKMPKYFDYQKRLLSSDEKRGRKIFAIILLSLLCIILTIKLLELGIETKGIYYRAWVNYLVYIIIRFVIPLLLVSYFILRLIICKREASDKVNKYIIKRELLLLIVGLGAFLFMVTSGYQLIYKTTIDKEEKIGEYYLMSDNQYLFVKSYAKLTYYNHYNFFTKTKHSDDIQIVKAILYDRYHEDFSINLDTGNPYNFIAKSKSSDFEFYVKKDGHNNYHDYYILTKFYDYIQDYIGEHQIQLEIDPKRDNLLYGITVYINDDDLENRAKELSEMISDLIKDEYFNTQGNCMDIVVDFDKTKYDDNYVTLTLGDQYTKQNEYSKDYYTNYDNVYNQLISVFSKNIDSTEKAEELLIDDLSNQEYKETIDENDLSIPESAYKKLYKTIFEPMGFSYLLNYNAKGNFYGLLGNREEEQDGESRTLRYTVVYDRQSKNGICQLFVEYRDCVYPGTNEIDAYSTEIVEFYAVNMMTGEVVAANKTAWSEVGSDEYQKMTGEF